VNSSVSKKKLDIYSHAVILSKYLGQFSCKFLSGEATQMAETDVKIIVKIKNYIEQHGGDFPSWYVGLGAYPQEKLLAHGVNLNQDPCIYLTAVSAENARNVERYFVGHLGTDADTHECTDENALSVYAYKKTLSTHP